MSFFAIVFPILFFFSNFNHLIQNVTSLPPLETNDNESVSDHNVVLLNVTFPCNPHFTKKKFTFTPYTKRGEEEFGRLLLSTNWSIIDSPDPNFGAQALCNLLDTYTKECFPEKTRTIKSTDKPWMNKKVASISRKKKREYKKHRRSCRWKRLEEESEELIESAKSAYFEKMKLKAKEAKNSRQFFQAVKQLSDDRKSSESWNISSLFPGADSAEIAGKVAGFFNKISQEYSPLLQPAVHSSSADLCPERYQIAARLRTFKKPNSRVKGDIFRQLVTKYSDILSEPLHNIFRAAFSIGVWPDLWKRETVIAIPKCARPKGLGDLRNLSCTPLFSKVMESFILDQLKREVRVGDAQFGVLKGSGVNHFLIETWDQILNALEDNRAVSTLASIDFEKAFNRVCHHECLTALGALGASPSTINMIRAFLTGRTMAAKVDGVLSEPLPISGGSPQGSILGNQLFCIVTQQLAQVEENHTLSLSDNGNTMEETVPSASPARPISPIQRPDLVNISLSNSSEEEEVLASQFICFRPHNRLYDSVLSDRATYDDVVREFGRPDNWVDRPLSVKVYIDDMNSIEKTATLGASSQISTTKRKLLVHSPKTQHFFETVAVKAGELKMKVNQSKTQLLCIHSSLHDEVNSFIRPTVNNEMTEITSQNNLKIVGFHFDSRPSVACHIQNMCDNFRSKLWSMRRLKRNGMKGSDLLDIYRSSLRPVIEFASPVYGPMLSGELSEKVEGLQLRAAKIIYGTNVSYASVLRETELETLKERRDGALKKFAIKASKNPKYQHWFPLSDPPAHNTRYHKKYQEIKCRTSRMYNSPIYTMRRILNEIN